jgi:hypothetical protein
MLTLTIFHPPETKKSLLGKLSCEERMKCLIRLHLFFLQKGLPNKEFLSCDNEKLSASVQRQARKFQGAATSVEDAVIIFGGLNLSGAHCTVKLT